MQTDSAVTTTEELLTALADPRRRELLRYLQDVDGEAVSVTELAAAVTGGGESGEYTDLHIGLQHVHLPKLADTGVLSFDARSGVVRYTGDERVSKLLEFVATELE